MFKIVPVVNCFALDAPKYGLGGVSIPGFEQLS